MKLALNIQKYLVIGCLFLGATLPISVNAESAMVISHSPPKPSELPSPGVPMTIHFQLSNSRELEKPVRGLFVRDGKTIEVPVFKSYLNDHDHATYEFKLNAPLAEINYQFFIDDGQHGTALSERYFVRRNCLPSIDLTNLTENKDASPDEQLKILFDRSIRLSDEVEQYEKAIRGIQELQALLKE